MCICELCSCKSCSAADVMGRCRMIVTDVAGACSWKALHAIHYTPPSLESVPSSKDVFENSFCRHLRLNSHVWRWYVTRDSPNLQECSQLVIIPLQSCSQQFVIECSQLHCQRYVTRDWLQKKAMEVFRKGNHSVIEKKCIVRVFPIAFPMAHHSRLLKKKCDGSVPKQR